MTWLVLHRTPFHGNLNKSELCQSAYSSAVSIIMDD